MKYAIIRTDKVHYEVWGGLSQIARAYGIPYHQISRKKFPFHFRGWDYIKVNYNQKAIT